MSKSVKFSKKKPVGSSDSKSSKLKPRRPRKGLERKFNVNKLLRLRRALKTVRSVKKEMMIEHKDGRIAFPSGGGSVLDEDSTSLAGSLVDLNKEYEFMFRGYTNISYTATVINTFFPCDPSASGSNFPEWGDVTPLFSEFKMVEFGVQIVNTRLDNSTTQEFQSLAIAGNLGTAAAPGSYATIVDNADSKLFAWWNCSTPYGITHTIKGTGLNWSVVTAPTTTPYAGAPGCIGIYSTGNASPSNVMNVLVWGIYKFRSRV